MRDFLVFIGMDFVVPRWDDMDLSKMTSPRAISSAHDMLTPLLSLLYSNFEDLGHSK